jgi:hypothetical protein
MSVADTPSRRVVPLPEVADPSTFVGTCDWGGCDREAWGQRWDADSSRYLTVCESCSRTTWTHGKWRAR